MYNLFKQSYLFIYSFIPKTIFEFYILKSIIPYFFMGVFIFSLVNFIQYLSDFVALAIQYQAPLWGVLKTVFYLIPFLMTFTVPIGVLLGIVLTLGQLTQNNEILTIRINGFSFFRIIKPIIFFGFILFLFQLCFFEWILPWGNYHFLEEKYKMMQKNPISQIEKKQKFSDGVRELKIANITDNTLYGVSFVDSQANLLYYAKTGTIKPSMDDKNFNIPITLYNATVFPYIYDNPDISDFSLQYFDQITVYLKIGNINQVIPEGSDLMSLSKIKNAIKTQEEFNTLYALRAFHGLLKINNQLLLETDTQKKISIQAQANSNLSSYQAIESRVHNIPDIYTYQKKLAFAVNVMIMTIIAIPLALFRKRHGKDIAIGLAIICVFIFNALIALSNFIYTQHILGAIAAAWLPSLLLFLLGIGLIGLRYKYL